MRVLPQRHRTWCERVTEWGVGKGLTKPEARFTQIAKLGEEFGELCNATIRNKSHEQVRDAIGDMCVVLQMLAASYDCSLDQCREESWTAIKDRTGTTVDGAFIKDSENE